MRCPLEASSSHFHCVRSSFKAWFGYLVKVTEEREDNPAEGISKPRKGQRHPPTLSLEEIRRLIETAVRDCRAAERLRNWTLSAFLVNTGLRVSELCSLDERSAKYRDGAPHSVTVIGKGDKRRTVVLSDNAKTALHQWMRHRKSLLLELPPGSEREAVWLIPAGRR